MEQVHLKYGTSAVDFEIDGAKSVKYLYENKMRVIEDIKAEFLHCVTDGVILSLIHIFTKDDFEWILFHDCERANVL